MYKKDGIVRWYSEGFKLKILSELNRGKYSKRNPGVIDGNNYPAINEWIKVPSERPDEHPSTHGIPILNDKDQNLKN